MSQERKKICTNAMIPSASWKNLLWAIAATSFLMVMFMYQFSQTLKPIFIEKNEFLYYDLNKEEPLIRDQECQLPRIHPFDPSITSYLTSPKAIRCKERIASLTFIDDEDPRSQKAASVLVKTINELLLSHANFCSEVTLAEILRADLIVPSREVVVNSRHYFGKYVEDGEASGMITKLRVIIRTKPGSALFEGTLLFRDDEEDISVLGDISRINRYNSQSLCIQDVVLRKYCFCENGNRSEDALKNNYTT
ncbi:unnamed protein product [Larinioides sclopetarius]|uniref:Uncharacterized protein n=1 Tax=Larinioides sclopetarius TaxID=280406 RepID=A0AAV1ZXG9_9ARAC